MIKSSIDEMRCNTCGHLITGPRWDVCKCNWDRLDEGLDLIANLDWITPILSIIFNGDKVEKLLLLILLAFLSGLTVFIVLPTVDVIFEGCL